MSLTIRFRSVAEEEIARIASTYESERLGLGKRFLDELERIFLNVSTFPFIYQFIMPRIRRAPMNHFPYSVFYSVEADEIVILACRHMHQDPASWPQ